MPSIVRRPHLPSRPPVAVLLLALLLLPGGARAGTLPGEIDRILRSSGLSTAICGVSVLESGSGRPLVSIRAHESFIPASNMKLLTTGAALHVLGADFAFRTRMLRDGDRITIVGDGDPAFGDPDLLAMTTLGEAEPGICVETFLDLFVTAIAGTGMTRIGGLIVDDRVFDRQFVHPEWPEDQLNRPYCAQVCGLNVHLNTLHFFPRPLPPNRPEIGASVPRTPWLSPANSATSVTGAKAENTAWIARRPGTNRLTFYGNVRHVYRVPIQVTMHDPAQLFAEILADRLRARGIDVPEDAPRVADAAAPPPSGDPIGPEIVSPLAVVLARANTDSQNLHAEAIFKRIGHAGTGRPGSWSDGAALVRLAAHERISDMPSELLIIADGSGLARSNRVSPALLTRWIESFVNDERLADPFLASLAVGAESGTLRDRMRRPALRGVTVQAKTGYIRGVSCLSGVITTNGERRVFSIMFNQMRASNAVAKDVQDRIVAAIAEDMQRSALRAGSD